jgi:haloacetate dehalogenase
MAFEGFRTARLPGARPDVTLHARIGGEGPPVLLLHGYPETHLAWRHVAPVLAQRFTVVVPDLRGYGESSMPADDAGHTVYAKSAMAADMVAAMASLGHNRFHLAGHDRGARVAYRLALEHPQAVERLAVLEIVPTLMQWRAFDARGALAAYHWTFLAQPAPMPERLIAGDPAGYLGHTLKSWTACGTLTPFEDGALATYHAAFAPRIAAFCADYRAGATTDRAADEADLAAGRRITAPTLLIAGQRSFPARAGHGDPAKLWQDFAPQIEAATVPGGHFLMEEAPEPVTAALLRHFGG